jgi:hypothetical protein
MLEAVTCEWVPLSSGVHRIVSTDPPPIRRTPLPRRRKSAIRLWLEAWKYEWLIVSFS